MDYHYTEAYVLLAEAVNSLELYDSLESLPSNQLTVIGIMRQESGYTIEPEQKDKNSLGENMVLSWRLEVALECLSTLPEADIDALETGLKSLVLVKPENGMMTETGLTLNAGTAPATVLAPVALRVKEAVKLGTGKITALAITGRRSRPSKDGLRKEIHLTQTASIYGTAVYGIGLYV